MRLFCLYIILITILFACKQKDAEVKPVDQCLTPTEVTIMPVSSGNIVFALVGTDSLSVGKVYWTIISQEKTLQIETNGKVSLTQKFSKSGEFKVTAVVETTCKTKATLTRSEMVQIGYFNKLWIREVGQFNDSTQTALVESIYGGCAAVISDNNSTRAISLDGSGNILWRKIIGPGINYGSTSIAKADDGGYVVIAPTSDYGILKITANGEKLWEKSFSGRSISSDGTEYNRLVKIINAIDGGYMLAGYSNMLAGGDKSESPRKYKENQSHASADYWIVKVNSLGVREWDKTLGGNDSDRLENIIGTTDGGYILFGSSYSGKSGDKTDASYSSGHNWMVKIGKTGVKEWDRSFPSSKTDMVALSDGSIVLFTESAFYPDVIGYTKLNGTGEILWQKRVPGKDASMIGSNDDSFIMVGGLAQFNVVRFSKDGEVQSSESIDLAGSYFPTRLALAKSKSGGFYGSVLATSQQSVVYVK